MAPRTRTPNRRKLHDEYAGLPSDLNTRLAAKTVARLKAVFRLRTATEARAKHQTNEHRSKAFNDCSMRAYGMEPKAQWKGRRRACTGYVL